MAYKIVQMPDGSIAADADGHPMQSYEDYTSSTGWHPFHPGQFTDCCCKKYILTPCFAGDVIYTHTDLSEYYPYLSVPKVLKLDDDNCYTFTEDYTNLPGTVAVNVVNAFDNWYGTGCKDCCNSNSTPCKDYSPNQIGVVLSGISLRTSCLACEDVWGWYHSISWTTPPSVGPNQVVTVTWDPTYGCWQASIPCTGVLTHWVNSSCGGGVYSTITVEAFDVQLSYRAYSDTFTWMAGYRKVGGGLNCNASYSHIKVFGAGSHEDDFLCRGGIFANGFVAPECSSGGGIDFDRPGYGGTLTYESLDPCGGGV